MQTSFIRSCKRRLMRAAALPRRLMRFCPALCRVIAGAALLCAFINSALGTETQYTYDDTGRLIGVIAPDGASVHYSHDAVGNILALQRAGSDAVVINSFAPGSGSTGSTVTITGIGFDAVAENNVVRFNGAQARVVAATTNTLTVSVPPDATTGKITVDIGGALFSSRTDFSVTASSAPAIAGFTPAIGIAGSTLSISGINFGPTVFDNKAALNGKHAEIRTATSTNLSIVVPEKSGSGKIQVNTAYGTALSAADFFVPPERYRVQDIESTGRMRIGETKAVSFTASDKLALILFDTEAGQRVSMTLSGVTISGGEILLVSPDGTTLASSYIWRSTDHLDFPPLRIAGTYTIVARPSSSGALSVRLNGFEDTAGIVAIGGPPVTITTTVPGQNASLDFNGTAGQRFSMRVSGLSHAVRP